MDFRIGKRLGADEITERISAGGMGEVYGARDTRLNRAPPRLKITEAT